MKVYVEGLWWGKFGDGGTSWQLAAEEEGARDWQEQIWNLGKF